MLEISFCFPYSYFKIHEEERERQHGNVSFLAGTIQDYAQQKYYTCVNPARDFSDTLQHTRARHSLHEKMYLAGNERPQVFVIIRLLARSSGIPVRGTGISLYLEPRSLSVRGKKDARRVHHAGDAYARTRFIKRKRERKNS